MLPIKLFRSSVCFGSIETSKLSVSVQKRNNRNKRFVSDSAETSFGSSFGCFESKLVSKDTLVRSKEQPICPHYSVGYKFQQKTLNKKEVQENCLFQPIQVLHSQIVKNELFSMYVVLDFLLLICPRNHQNNKQIFFGYERPIWPSFFQDNEDYVVTWASFKYLH